MAVQKPSSRSNLGKTLNNEFDKVATEEKTNLDNKNNTIKRIPTVNREDTASEQTHLSERDIKSASIINKLHGILKLCVEAVVSVFSYICDKIDSFFAYILSKFLPLAKLKQRIPIIPTNDKDYIVAEIPREDSEPFKDNKDTEIIIDTETQNITTEEGEHQDKNTAIEDQISEKPAIDNDSILTEIPLKDNNPFEDNRDAELTIETETESILTKKYEHQDKNTVIEDQIPEKPENKKLPSDTAYAPIQPDLAVTNKNNAKKTQQKGLFGSLKSHLRRTLNKEQKRLDNSFHDFFKKYSKSACDIDTLTKMSSCSQEDFNKMFIDKSIYYFKKNSRKEPTPSDLLTFINNTISFVNMVINSAIEADKIQAKKCKNMMEKALENHIEFQVNAGGNDIRSFTANDSLFYMKNFIDEHLHKITCSKKTADSDFLVDIVRYDPHIEFFENNKPVWNSSDLEAVEMTKKLKTCNAELTSLDQSTKEYADKSHELEEIKTELVQYRRAQIKKFLAKDNSEITNFLLKEQSQAAAAAPAILAMSYVMEKLNDAFNHKAPAIALPNEDRKFNITFYKTSDDKIIIKTSLSGKITFITDDIAFRHVCPYEVTTEIEYDFENPDNNRIIKGQLKLSPTV
jgi:hypothetical protein